MNSLPASSPGCLAAGRKKEGELASLSNGRGSWVVGTSRGSWVWVWVKVVGVGND